MSDEEVWSTLEKLLDSSTCVKTHTAAALVKDGKIIAVGYNMCAPEGQSYGDKLSVCPRAKITTGSNYELCAPMHAEVMACLNIRSGRNKEEISNYASHLKLSPEKILEAFSTPELERLNGSTLYLMGHYWACDGCRNFLKVIGITDIKLNSQSAAQVKATYVSKDITRDPKN